MKKFFWFLTIIVIAIAAYYMIQSPADQNLNTDNILIVGTSADYPPYESIDLATGKIIGLDIDIINEIAQRLGKKIVFKDMPFNSLMLNLAAGQMDLVAAGLSSTEDRKEAVMFSSVYLDNDCMVIVTKTNTPPLNSVTDLYGKTVAVNIGYNADAYLSTMPEINLVRLKSAADSALALQADSVDAFATSKSSFNIFVQNNKNPENYRYLAIPNSSESCAFAFAKNNHTLKEQIDAVLEDMKQDGTLQEIQKKWGFND